MAHIRRSGWMRHFERAASSAGVRLDMLIAVASRETHGGQMPPLARNWTGDSGHGRGIMQIDDRWHPAFIRAHRNDDHAANIGYAARLLKSFLDQAAGTTGTGALSEAGRYFWALSAYNSGPGNVRKAIRSGRTPEAYTTGGDYATDVLARAETVRRELALSTDGTAPLPSGLGPFSWGQVGLGIGAAGLMLDPTFGALTGMAVALLGHATSRRTS